MASNSKILHRLGLSDCVRILSMSTGYVETGQCKGTSPVREIINILFRVGRFWEAVGWCRVHAAWLYVC